MANNSSNLYFAYGSNLNKADLLSWCEKNNCKYPFTEEPFFAARLVDYRLVFNHFSQTKRAYALNVMKSVGISSDLTKLKVSTGWIQRVPFITECLSVCIWRMK